MSEKRIDSRFNRINNKSHNGHACNYMYMQEDNIWYAQAENLSNNVIIYARVLVSPQYFMYVGELSQNIRYIRYEAGLNSNYGDSRLNPGE